MSTLVNNDELAVDPGDYVYQNDGALDIQLKMEGGSFATITDGSLSSAGSGLLTLPKGDTKIVNASSNSLIIVQQ